MEGVFDIKRPQPLGIEAGQLRGQVERLCIIFRRHGEPKQGGKIKRAKTWAALFSRLVLFFFAKGAVLLRREREDAEHAALLDLA